MAKNEKSKKGTCRYCIYSYANIISTRVTKPQTVLVCRRYPPPFLATEPEWICGEWKERD